MSNANQPRNQNQTPHGNQNRTPNEDFDLRETSPSLGGGRLLSGTDRLSTAFDLVEPMHYFYIRVVKAKELPPKDGNGGSPDPFVEVKLGSFNGVTKHFEKNSTPEWNQVFAFLKDRIQANVFEVLVRDKDKNDGDDMIGMVVFDVSEVPSRVPPDSPLAPQWYRLVNKNGDRVNGELMLAIWMGTQADEAFPDASHLDATSVSDDGVANIRSKVYLSPKLWYLRVNVIEAQELVLGDRNRQQPEIFVKAVLGNFVLRTKISQSRNLSPLWNEDLMFAVAEPFEEQLIISVEDKMGANKEEEVGKFMIGLQGVEKRFDFKTPISRWYNLEKHTVSEDGQTNVTQLSSRLHVRVSLDGGYHVLDELTQYSSDLRATAKQLSQPPIGVLELGILNGRGLSSMKTVNGRGVTDAYCVAKYGQKWIRTRTILNSFNPKWNEQYTWEVFDPCTVITIGVFDNCHLQGVNREGGAKDSRIGKVRIRLSTLEADRVYTHSYPLIVLSPSGVKKMGEIQLAVRFTCSSFMNMLQLYKQPLLPSLHYLHPLTSYQVDTLRHQATQIVATRLGRAEPPLRKEMVEYMLDVGSNMWSVRRSKANHLRIVAVLSGVAAFFKWFDDICTWKIPYRTVIFHIFFVAFVFSPRLFLSVMFLTLSLTGIFNYKYKPRHPPYMDIKLSQADKAHNDELDEEFDTFPTSRQADVLKFRYDRLRSIASRVQTVAGDIATQGERFYSLLSWRDPRATSLFLIFCFIASIVLWCVPSQHLVIVTGLFVMRHPRLRNSLPSLPVNFFRRLPARTDSLL